MMAIFLSKYPYLQGLFAIDFYIQICYYIGKLDCILKNVFLGDFGVLMEIEVTRKKPKNMKRIIFVVIVLGTICFLALFPDKKTLQKKAQVENNADAGRELQKEYTLLKVLSYKPRSSQDTLIAVDANGHKLQLGRWYIRTNDGGTLSPYNMQNSTRIDLEQLAYAEQKKYLMGAGHIVIDTFDALPMKAKYFRNESPIIGTVEVICFPKHRITTTEEDGKLIGTFEEMP